MARGSIPHEYFHILQGQSASGFAQLQTGETAYYSHGVENGAYWLVEGLATYADSMHTL